MRKTVREILRDGDRFAGTYVRGTEEMSAAVRARERLGVHACHCAHTGLYEQVSDTAAQRTDTDEYDSFVSQCIGLRILIPPVNPGRVEAYRTGAGDRGGIVTAEYDF